MREFNTDFAHLELAIADHRFQDCMSYDSLFRPRSLILLLYDKARFVAQFHFRLNEFPKLADLFTVLQQTAMNMTCTEIERAPLIMKSHY